MNCIKNLNVDTLSGIGENNHCVYNAYKQKENIEGRCAGDGSNTHTHTHTHTSLIDLTR